MSAIQAWFPTFIYKAPLQGSGLARTNHEIADECYQLRDFDDAGRRWCKKNYPGGYTSYGSYPQLHTFSSTFTELEKKIRRHVLKFATHLDFDLQGRSLTMTDCWVNIMPPQVQHSLHLHPLSVISGTYYVRTPRGCSGLKFEDPRMASFMAAPPRRADTRDENRTHITLPAEAGSLILFESWLRHEVAANPTKQDRISISFNYHWM
ncbi:MAG TPA: TIGR02466 family protein [Opitutaceae bacterium]|nr:TIGR02466 family protein [Opitutaceae bacterium]